MEKLRPPKTYLEYLKESKLDSKQKELYTKQYKRENKAQQKCRRFNR